MRTQLSTLSNPSIKLTTLTQGERPTGIMNRKAQKEWDAKAARTDAFVTGVAASVAGSLVVTVTTGAAGLAISAVKLATNKARVKRATKKMAAVMATAEQQQAPQTQATTQQQAPQTQATTQQQAPQTQKEVDAEA